MRLANSLSPILYVVLPFTAYICITQAIRCHCYKSSSLGLPNPQCVFLNYVCHSDIGCYLRRYYSDHPKQIVQMWGCIPNEYNQINYTALFCGPSNTRTDAYDCCYTDFCNDNLSITLQMELETVTPSPSVYVTPKLQPHAVVNAGLVAATCITVTTAFILLGLLLCVLCVVLRRRCILRQQVIIHCPTTGSSHKHWTHDPELSTSDKGSDLPYKVLTDIEDMVKLNYQIEIGRIGTFYNGSYEEVETILKKFEEGNRSAWLRESIMYHKVLQSHDNILTYFASAMVNHNGGSELWLVTEYHEFGSLQDYLRQHTVTPKVILQMAVSICSGLAHLHFDSADNQVKIPVAHCNLTSRNILVKGNLSCCIGDFRLAVYKYSNEVHQAEDAKPGTTRYMAPEVLDNSLNFQSFESFKQVDVYALGLVLWEICLRRDCPGSGVLPEVYQVPFQGLVPPDPSVEDMKRVVVIDKTTPTIPKKWNYNKLLCEMTKVMSECWYFTSTARPTAVYLKKKLLKMFQEFENMNFADKPMTSTKDDYMQRGNVCVSTL